MKVSTRSWHTRIYLWWYEQKYGVKKYISGPGMSNTNLCPYMRAIMFWAPFRAIFYPAFELFTIRDVPVYQNYLTIPTLMYVIPKLLGYLSYNAKFVFWMIYGVTAAIVVACLIVFGIIQIFSRDGLGYGVYVENAVTNAGEKAEPFFKLVGAYLRSGHDRICPEVEIID